MKAAMEALRSLLGARLSVEADDCTVWGRDWTRAIQPNPVAVAWPRDTHEVSAILGICSQHALAVVPSGGRTGLAGGAVARAGELVLSLDRLRTLGAVDAVGQTITVGAGVPNQVLQDHCQPQGLWWPVDLAAKGSATVGGNLATNAGGVRVIRYGQARNWVLGVQAVTMAGEVLQLGGALVKDNSGYALQQLLVGSEGTLAVITEATLRLTALPGPSSVLLLACTHLEAVLNLLAALRNRGALLNAFEVFSGFCLQQVGAHTGMKPPLTGAAPWYSLIELENSPTVDIATLLPDLLASQGVLDGTLAVDRHQAAKLWAWRERIAESLVPHDPHKNDVAVPVAALGAFVAALQDWAQHRTGGPQIALFGHVGDGNLHVNTLRPEGWSAAAFAEACATADDFLFALVAKLGGSISAEHGIGLLKKRWLPLTRGPAELAAMRAIKTALDPQNLLNPGKIFDHP